MYRDFFKSAHFAKGIQIPIFMQLFVQTHTHTHTKCRCLTEAHSECEATLEDCRALIRGDHLDALSKHEDKMQDVGSICKKIRGLSFDPLINPIVRCSCKSTKNMAQRVSSGCVFTLECSDGEPEQLHEPGEEGTECISIKSLSMSSSPGKAKHTTSSPLSTTSLPRLEPLDIKFHNWPPKLEPVQLHLRELSTPGTLSVEHLDASTDSVPPWGSVALSAVEGIAQGGSCNEVWFANSPLSVSNEHGVIQLNTSGSHDDDKEEHDTDADEDDEQEGEGSSDHHHPDNDANPLLGYDHAGSESFHDELGDVEFIVKLNQ